MNPSPEPAVQHGPATPRRSVPRLLLMLLAAIAGAVLGYDVGLRIAGVWLGMLMSLNTAFFAAVLMAWLFDAIRVRLGPQGDGNRRD